MAKLRIIIYRDKFGFINFEHYLIKEFMRNISMIILGLVLIASVLSGCKSRRKNRCATCPTWSLNEFSSDSDLKIG